jgi:hypothetical protein
LAFAYDSDAPRAADTAKGVQANVPNNPSHAKKQPLDKPLCAERRLVECCFSRFEQVPRIATRDEKTARNDVVIFVLAAVVVWPSDRTTGSVPSNPGFHSVRSGLALDGRGVIFAIPSDLSLVRETSYRSFEHICALLTQNAGLSMPCDGENTAL